MEIWNEEIIQDKTFPAKLKLADISPIFKKLESIFVKNYRPISVLPVVSKVFERIMQKQTHDKILKLERQINRVESILLVSVGALISGMAYVIFTLISH